MCAVQYIRVPYETYLHAAATAKYNPDLPVSDQIDCLAYDASWEFPKECLKFGVLFYILSLSSFNHPTFLIGL